MDYDDPRSDVCPDAQKESGDGVIWNDDVELELVLQVENQLVDEGGLELVDGSSSMEGQEAWQEDG